MAIGSYGVVVVEGRAAPDGDRPGAVSEFAGPVFWRIELAAEAWGSLVGTALGLGDFDELDKGIEPPAMGIVGLDCRDEPPAAASSASTWICAETMGGSPAKCKSLAVDGFAAASENDIAGGGRIVDEAFVAGTAFVSFVRAAATGFVGFKAGFDCEPAIGKLLVIGGGDGGLDVGEWVVGAVVLESKFAIEGTLLFAA